MPYIIFLLQKLRLRRFVFVVSDRWDFIDTTGEQKIFKIRQVHVHSPSFSKDVKIYKLKNRMAYGKPCTHTHTNFHKEHHNTNQQITIIK